MQTYKNHSLLAYNTFGIDQKCDELIVYDSTEDAIELATNEKWGIANSDYFILGGGSNILLTKDFHGKVITAAKKFSVMNVSPAGSSDKILLRCWAGTTFDDVVNYAVEHQLYGLENLSLIPGECGASAVQNIGAYGAEIKDVIQEIEAVELSSGRVVTIGKEESNYSYRQSKFKNEWKNKYLIISVVYELSRFFRPQIDYGNIKKHLIEMGFGLKSLTAHQLRTAIIELRTQKLPDPEITGNAGSFFMNPIVDEVTFKNLVNKYSGIKYYEVPLLHDMQDNENKPPVKKVGYKIPAGWMIEQCGWKGKQLGKAGVHDKQALVLVNRGGASGNDIIHLMQAIQKDVKDKFGLDLQPEVNII